MNTDFIDYKLKQPVEYGGLVITELKIREPRGRELKFLPMGEPQDFQLYHEITALLCGQTPQFMDLLAKADWAEVMKITGGFFSEAGTSSGKPPCASPENPST